MRAEDHVMFDRCFSVGLLVLGLGWGFGSISTCTHLHEQSFPNMKMSMGYRDSFMFLSLCFSQYIQLVLKLTCAFLKVKRATKQVFGRSVSVSRRHCAVKSSSQEAPKYSVMNKSSSTELNNISPKQPRKHLSGENMCYSLFTSRRRGCGFRQPLGMINIWQSVCLLLSVLVVVDCYSTGAPAGACSDIYPVGHSGTSQDLSTNPFQLSLSDFDQTHGGEIYYVPGHQYTLTLSGSGGEQFRGFLVQARTVSDGTPVGTFIDYGDDQALSSCTPIESAMTHSSNSLKSSLTLMWTSPPQGTGEVHFLFSIVVDNITFYATAKTSILHPCALPLYESAGHCVKTCPNGQFGSGNISTLTGTCDPLPLNYTVALNATVYYATIDIDHPLNTPVFRVRVITSNISNIGTTFISMVEDNQLFEFEGGSNDGRSAQRDDYETDGHVHVFDAFINLVAEPSSRFEGSIYLVSLDIDIELLVIYNPPNDQPSTIEIMVKGLGCFQNTSDPCYSEPCENGATCHSVNSCEYSCSCSPGFTGDRCQEDDRMQVFCDSKTCMNGGTCNELYGPETNCSCASGFTGVQCKEDDLNVKFCSGIICPNGSICVEEFGNKTSCQCIHGYRGDQCTEDDPTTEFCDEVECMNGGTCLELHGPSTECQCTSGFMGTTCSEDNPNDIFCNEPTNTCANGGTCNELYGTDTDCSCVSGFTGDHCQEDDPSVSFCTENTCQNKGICHELYGTDTNCGCASGFTGDHCQEDDPSVSFCVENTCQHGGTCNEDFGDSVNCSCAAGFVGERCEWSACSTNGNVCQNGGTCYQIEDGSPAMCDCPPQFTGSNCETALCAAEAEIPVYPGSSVNYSWPATEAGSSQTQPCPSICEGLIDYPSGGVVERVCQRESGQWLETNITLCGLTITALQLCEASQRDTPLDVATAVLSVTTNPSTLDHYAISVISGIISILTHEAVDDTQVCNAYLGIIDNVLEARKDELLISEIESNSSSKILQELRQFHNEIPPGDRKKTIRRNFGVIILDINTADDGEMYDSFSADLGEVEDAVMSNENISTEQLIVSSEILSNATGSVGLEGLDACFHSRDPLRIVYSVYRTDALFLTPETACDLYAISTIIVGVSVNDSACAAALSASLDMQQLTEVCTSILLMNDSFKTAAYQSSPVQHQQEPLCSNYKTAADGVGRWSSEDCKKISTSGGRTKCDCSQLGHFGLFFDLNPGKPLSPLALAVISYVGVTVSVLCLVLLLLTYLSSKTLRRKEHGKILINISASLLGLYVLFVLAGVVTSVEPLCGLVAALFQYIMLVFFGWTAAEAVFLYHNLVVVLGNPIEHFVWKAGVIVWLAPLIITAISVGPGYNYYVNPFYCRVTEWPFWMGLILPVSIIGIFNWVVFVLIMVKLCRGTVDTEKDNVRRTFKKNFFIAVGLSLLLGLGWGFGLTATSSDLQELTFALQVIFSLFVGSQGVFIFVFHGLRSPQFRLVWMSAFGLRSKGTVSKYSTKKQAGSGTDSNMTVGGALSTEPLKHPWGSQNRIVSNTGIDFDRQWATQMSSFEPHGDSVAKSVKDREEHSL